MSPELLTALVRATNDGVIPAPFAGEDTYDYRLRCALAGASVTMAWARAQAANAAAHADSGDVTVTSPLSPDNPYAAGPMRDVRPDDEIGVD